MVRSFARETVGIAQAVEALVVPARTGHESGHLVYVAQYTRAMTVWVFITL